RGLSSPSLQRRGDRARQGDGRRLTALHQILPLPRKPYALNWLPERLVVSHYEKDYGSAVRSLNALRDRLAAIDPSSVTPAEIRALKREELSAVGSVILHELYFMNLGGDGKAPAVVTNALESNFGGVHQWRREFVGAAQSLAGGPGWVVLSYSPMTAGFTTTSPLITPRPWSARCQSWCSTCTSTLTTW